MERSSEYRNLYTDKLINDRTERKLKGTVKTITQETFHGFNKGKNIDFPFGGKIVSTYNEIGYIIEENEYDWLERNIRKFTSVFSSKGCIQTENIYYPDGYFPEGAPDVWEKQNINEYDEKGNLIKSSDFMQSLDLEDSEGSKQENIKDNLKEELEENKEKTFNSKGNNVVNVKFDSDTDLKTNKTIVTAYDNRGNWTCKTEFSYGHPEKIIKREITYYE